MAFGDAEGTIHLLSQADALEGVPFNGFDGHPVEWGDMPATIPEVTWTDATCVYLFVLPFCSLLSSSDP